MTNNNRMDWHEVENQLRGRALEVARHLFPNGKQDGQEWVVGSLAGEAGKSLKVALGSKAGTWHDFAASEGGKTLISLWSKVRGSFKVAIVEAKSFLGIRDDFERRVRPAVATPAAREEDASAWAETAETWKRCQPLVENGPVWKYLVEERKIDPGALRLFDVREMLSKSQWVMVFPYYQTPGGEAPMVRTEDRGIGRYGTPEWLKFELLGRVDGKKREWVTRGAEKSLWGVQLSEYGPFDKCGKLLICEGEKDALSWCSMACWEWDVLPVSVPFGAKWRGKDPNRPSPNREWMDRSWEWMEQFQEIFVAMDGDEAGQRAAQDLITELGPRRCRLVEMPGKGEDGRQMTEDRNEV